MRQTSASRFPAQSDERGPSVTDGQSAQVRIVGIGTSAGGLPALEQFFLNIPGNSGLAYVVVQHLDPTQKALLVELLQRMTTMPVRQAEPMLAVVANCVYVIAPNTEISVNNGILLVTAPSEPRGLRLPINVLFSSLARDQRELAIAVVLSGMGSDGTLGLQAIKALGGLSAVQQPESAQFDSMPKSAIAAGCGDIVALPADLPGRILSTIHRTSEREALATAGAESAAVSTVEPMQRIFTLVHQQTKHDFSLYKSNTIQRRVERRMAIHSLATRSTYADYLEANPQEVALLFKELLIGVTSFFRDPPVWQQLAEIMVPQLLERQHDNSVLRAWVVGCSTGEEAYSLAMVFAETVQKFPEHRERTLQIFATDINPDAIATARKGEYPASSAADIGEPRLSQYFSQSGGVLRIVKPIRDMVLFAQQDVILEPPFTRLDFICCRNLMIYFDAALQHRLLPLFHYSLRSGGILVLGSSETVGRFNRLFSALNGKMRVYQRHGSVPGVGPDYLLGSFPPLSNMRKESAVVRPPVTVQSPDNLQAAADNVLLQVYAPPAVVVNTSGDIVYISGSTGKYLEPAAGKANWNFHAMARKGLRGPLTDALIQITQITEPLVFPGLEIQGLEGLHIVDVTLQLLREPAALQGMIMIVFRDVAVRSSDKRLRSSRGAKKGSQADQMQQFRDEMASLREEARASKEELQSANEELQSTNEELQSANEELTTSKEEMQSMNEELQTINAEMQTRLDDLALAQSDMRNLLNSTDIAILFLDGELNVRRYTDQAAKIINLREIDVGRPLSDLTTSLRYPSLYDDAQNTMRTLMFSERQVVTDDQRWFSVRIMPYRRLDNVIDGAVITFVDITATKTLEANLREKQSPGTHER